MYREIKKDREESFKEREFVRKEILDLIKH